jgi:2OG-Fe(II) oxygenase superfamily
MRRCLLITMFLCVVLLALMRWLTLGGGWRALDDDEDALQFRMHYVNAQLRKELPIDASTLANVSATSIAALLSEQRARGKRRQRGSGEFRRQLNKFDAVFEQLTVLSDSPRVFHAAQVVGSDDCKRLIGLAVQLTMERSSVDIHNGRSGADNWVRTSSGAWLSIHDVRWSDKDRAAIARVRERVALLSHVPVEHQEDIYLTRYDYGEEYRPHVDYFAKTNGAELVHGGQRHATVVVYLNTLEPSDPNEAVGGETHFTATNVRVAPRQGDVLLFYNTQPNGAVDKRSRHAGLPLHTHRPKWIASIWIRERPRI